MELKLNRPLLFFDIESTGLNIASDSIIELSFVKVFPGGEQRIKTWKIKPWDYETRRQRPISPSASAVNGVKDEDLVDCPRFCDVVDEVVEWIGDSDLAGFNSAKFDLPLLAEEIERVRHYLGRDFNINLHEKKMVDVQNIYHFKEPRNLKAAYRFYCGGDFENAHTAEADTVATYEVLKSQLDMYDDLKNDVDALSAVGGRPRVVDYAGRLIYNDDKEAIISFGKHKGKTAREVYLTEPSYFSWIMNGEFTLDTKRQFALLKEQFDKERKAGAAAKRKPLNDSEVADAAKLLSEKWTGKLF
ncbi:MAG: 3'-5' exonuclease [Bacteroidales bacterium]|nr:3'-5' exonuclease [Bacteroidales bacterium]MBR5054559.1 3'-5' exonuclease [Bacteroidales bacterium]